ncbi:MAG: energy-coupling factor transporter transmembrane component T [bacterium]|nr:energy-coupling factor transporter transmembrane component T [bacterium]
MSPCETLETGPARPRPHIALGGAIATAFAAAALPAGELAGAGIVAGLLLVNWIFLKPRPRGLLRWFLRGVGILTLITAATPFFGPGTPVGSFLGLTVYREGLLLWASIVSRGMVAVLAVGAAVSALGANGTVIALARFPLPRVISGLFAVSWLQLHLLGEEMARRKRAVELRGPDAGRALRRRALGGTLGAVFKKSLDRGHRLGLAMCLRGDGEPTFTKGAPLRDLDWIYMVVAILPFGVTLWTYLD